MSIMADLITKMSKKGFILYYDDRNELWFKKLQREALFAIIDKDTGNWHTQASKYYNAKQTNYGFDIDSLMQYI